MTKLYLTLMLVALVGCVSTPAPPPRIEIKTVVVTPPKELVADCPIPAPPKTQDYLKLQSFDAKEEVLIDSLASYIEKAHACNLQLFKLRSWIQESSKK